MREKGKATFYDPSAWRRTRADTNVSRFNVRSFSGIVFGGCAAL